MKINYYPSWPGMGASADSPSEETGSEGGPSSFLSFRLVSVECDDGGRGVASGSGSPKQRVLWPCLYFSSAEDMIHSLVTYELISPSDAKVVRNHCAALRLSMLAQRRPPGAAVAYLLGKDRTSLPGASEREAIGVGTPVVIPDEDPVDFIDHYAAVEDAMELEERQELWDAFCGAVDEWSGIQDAVEAASAGTGGQLSLASFQRSPMKKRKGPPTSLDASSPMPPHASSKTPRPEPKAPPVAMVTDVRPSAAASVNGAVSATDHTHVPAQLKDIVYTPALTGGARSARADHVHVSDAGSSIMSPCPLSGLTPGGQQPSSDPKSNVMSASVGVPVTAAPAQNVADTSGSDESTGSSLTEAVLPPPAAPENAPFRDEGLPKAGEDKREGSTSVDQSSVGGEDAPQPTTAESPPNSAVQSDAVKEASVALGQASGSAVSASANEHPPDSPPKCRQPAHSAGGDAGGSTRNDGVDPVDTLTDPACASVPASSSAGTVVSNDGSTFDSPSPASRALARSTASTTRTRRSLSAKIKTRIEGRDAKKSPSKHHEPEMDRLNPIPSFLTIKRLLQKAGFGFDNDSFTRPTGESFSSEEDFRRDLCKYGLDDYDGWSGRERKQVSDWVRYTHVKVGASRDFEVLSPQQFISYGERLGMKYRDAYYILPNGCAEDTEVKLQVHLCRFGLPRECRIDALNETELLSFTMFFAQSDHYNPFERKNRVVLTSGKKLRPRPSLDSSVGENSNIHLSPCHPMATKASAKHASRSSKEIPTPTMERRLGKVAAEPASPCFPLSPLARAPASPTVARTCREMLVACRDLPTKSSRLVYPSNSNFEACANKVESFVRCVIDAEASHGSSEAMPASLYVCGAPGLGKTAAVRACCESLAVCHSEDVAKPLVCYVNASTMDASPQPDAVLLQRIADTIDMRYSRLPQINSIKGYMTKKHLQVIVIIDEIDILLSNKVDASTAVTSKQEMALEMLADWAADSNLPIGVIGISNRKGNTKYERLKHLLKFAEVVDFKPYSQSDISHIVETLVGPSVIDKPGLLLIGAKTEQNRGGDIRYAFEVVSKAAGLCMETLSEDELNATPAPGTTLIKMGCVHKVFQAENAHIRVAINGLPATGKALLVILSTLAEEHDQFATVKELKNFSSLVGINENETMSAENFVFMLSTLCDNGLLEVGGKPLQSLSLQDVNDVQVKLGLCLDEVTAVVNDEICKNRVLAQVRDRVREHRTQFKKQNQREPVIRGNRGK